MALGVSTSEAFLSKSSRDRRHANLEREALRSTPGNPREFRVPGGLTEG